MVWYRLMPTLRSKKGGSKNTSLTLLVKDLFTSDFRDRFFLYQEISVRPFFKVLLCTVHDYALRFHGYNYRGRRSSISRRGTQVRKTFTVVDPSDDSYLLSTGVD